jgi:hypothetical protein
LNLRFIGLAPAILLHNLLLFVCWPFGVSVERKILIAQNSKDSKNLMRLATCTNDICHNGGTCISNAQNSSKLCLCPTGFQGSTCQYDVNECKGIVVGKSYENSGLVNNGGCHQACINTIGNFYCSCFPGYELGENEKCVDIG